MVVGGSIIFICVLWSLRGFDEASIKYIKNALVCLRSLAHFYVFVISFYYKVRQDFLDMQYIFELMYFLVTNFKVNYKS